MEFDVLQKTPVDRFAVNANLAKLFVFASVAAMAATAAAGARGARGALPDPDTAQCDPAGQVFLLLPHHTDCGKYYMCNHGQEVEFPCSGGLIFDYQLQTCNWEWATECVLRTPAEEASEESEIIGEGSGEGSGDWYEPESRLGVAATSAHATSAHAGSDRAVAQLNCAVPQLSTRLAPYRGDCQRFWRCSGGAAEAAFCSDGLYFNPRTLQCDHEANVPCARDARAVEEIGDEFLPY